MKSNLIDDIQSRLSIEAVIGSYLDLKPAGSNLKALSPFKNEKTPSLMVSPAKNLWKDFSSNKGGTLFTFVMEYEQVDFRQALKILAEKAGLNWEDYQNPARAKQVRDLKDRQNLALKIFQIADSYYQEKFQKTPKPKTMSLKTGVLRLK